MATQSRCRFWRWAALGVVCALVLSWLATQEVARAAFACKTCGMWMHRTRYEAWGVDLWTSKTRAYSTPLSRFLQPNPDCTHRWALLRGTRKHLIRPSSEVVIRAPEEHRRWFQQFLVKVLLNAEGEREEEFGDIMTLALLQEMPVDWGLWRTRAGEIGIAVPDATREPTDGPILKADAQ